MIESKNMYYNVNKEKLGFWSSVSLIGASVVLKLEDDCLPLSFETRRQSHSAGVVMRRLNDRIDLLQITGPGRTVFWLTSSICDPVTNQDLVQFSDKSMNSAASQRSMCDQEDTEQGRLSRVTPYPMLDRSFSVCWVV